MNSTDSDLQDLRNRIERLENCLKITPISERNKVSPEKLEDPPESKLVYIELANWLADSSEQKVHSWTKVSAATNEVRQILFERQKKAETKEEFGGGLKLNQGPDGLITAAMKLADALFFLFKHHREDKPGTRTELVKQDNGLRIVKDLLLLLQNVINKHQASKLTFPNKENRH